MSRRSATPRISATLPSAIRSRAIALLHAARALGLHEDDRVVVDDIGGDDPGQLLERASVDRVEQPPHDCMSRPARGGISRVELGARG